MKRNPAPAIDAQRDYYDQRWSSQADGMTPDQRERAAIALEAVGDVFQGRPLRILEVGSGRGALSAELARFGSVTSLELSPEAVKLAKERYADRDITFLAGDFFETPLPENAFDYACTMEVIEHVEDQRAFVKRLAARLRPGGALVVTTPNRWVARLWQRTVGTDVLQPIENWLSRKELLALVSRDFTVLRSGTCRHNVVYAGPLRWLNSPKLNRVFPFLATLERRFGWGLHLYLIARKR